MERSGIRAACAGNPGFHPGYNKALYRSKPTGQATGFVLLLGQCISERTKQLCAIAPPGTAVHTGEGSRLRGREPFEYGAGILGVGIVVQAGTHCLTRPEDVRLGERWEVGATLGEEVAAQEGACVLLHEKAALPGVRQVRRVKPLHNMCTK